MKDKIGSIEQTVEKNNVRHNFVGQVEQYLWHREAQGKPVLIINALNLPGESWYADYLLINAIKHSFILETKPEIHVSGVESSKKTAIKAVMNMPADCSLTCCKFEDFLSHEVKVSQSGVGFLQEQARQIQPDYNVIWADYCNNATPKSIEAFAKMIDENLQQGVAYVTYKVNTRTKGGDKKYLRQFKSGKRSDNVRETVRDVTTAIVQHIAKDKKINLIYDVMYGGGKKGNTYMLTIGYSVNVPQKAIQVIQEDRTVSRKENRRKHYQIVNKLEKARGWSFGSEGKVGKRGKAKVSMTTEEAKEKMRLYLAVRYYEAKWKKLDSEKKARIASKNGLEIRQFASRVAWWHGKLKSNRYVQAA